MLAHKLVWKAAAALLLVAFRVALWARLHVESQLPGRVDDELARLRRLGAV